MLYAGMSGRSATVALGRVIRFGPKSVTVARLKDARGFRSGGRTRYIDTRTGKGIDPFHNDKGIARDSGYENAETGEFVANRELWSLSYDERRARYPRMSEGGPWRHVSWQLHPWIEVVTPESQVTLTVLENVTKWTGEVAA